MPSVDNTTFCSAGNIAKQNLRTSCGENFSTRISENIFSNRVGSLTSEDGSDLKEFFEKLFDVLNTKEEERGDIPNYLNSFPYVNGGLFKEKVEVLL